MLFNSKRAQPNVPPPRDNLGCQTFVPEDIAETRRQSHVARLRVSQCGGVTERAAEARTEGAGPSKDVITEKDGLC